MKNQRCLIRLLPIELAALLWVGPAISACNTAPLPGGDVQDVGNDDFTPNSNGDSDLQTDDDANDTPDNGPSDVPDSELSPLHAEAVSRAVRAASFIAAAAIAAQPFSELQGFLDGTTELPQCPQISVAVEGSDVLPTMSYEPACFPDAFPTVEIAGAVTGRSFLAVDAFETTEVTLRIDQGAFGGMVSGGINTQPDVTTLALNLVIEGEGFTAQGSCTAEMREPEGEVSLPTATLSIPLPSLEEALAVYGSLIFDGASLMPIVGSVTIEMPPDSSGHRAQLEATFNAATPSTRTVQVQLDGGTALTVGY